PVPSTARRMIVVFACAGAGASCIVYHARRHAERSTVGISGGRHTVAAVLRVARPTPKFPLPPCPATLRLEPRSKLVDTPPPSSHQRVAPTPLTAGLPVSATPAAWPPRGTLRFDWLIAGLSAWFLGGIYLDGWAHTHVPALETFFTPWHAVLYSGFAAVAFALAVTQARNMRHGAPWR